jgi:hypothetical protein
MSMDSIANNAAPISGMTYVLHHHHSVNQRPIYNPYPIQTIAAAQTPPDRSNMNVLIRFVFANELSLLIGSVESCRSCT